MTDKSALEIQANDFSAGELNAKIDAAEADTPIRLLVREPMHGICAGLDREIAVSVKGNVGDFAFTISNRGEFDVHGNAGDGCGHSFVSGSLLIRGAVGDSLGAFATGGFIAVHASAGNRCAMGLAGADVFVRSAVGDEAGYAMRDGALVLGNGAGTNVGLDMTGGIIYIRGEVKSVAPNARQTRMKDAEALRLSLFLARAGIKGGGTDFKVYRAKPASK